MKVRNVFKNTTFHFTDEEVLELFMYTYGYLDLVNEGVLNIAVDESYQSATLRKKFMQCFEGAYKSDKKIIKKER